MDNNQASEILQHLGKYTRIVDGETVYHADLIEAREIAIAALTDLTALREANRWISVAERLPEESGRYLVQVNRIASECLGGNSNFMRIKMFMNGEWAYGTHSPAWINGELKDCVTHWRPLPTVPEKGE